MGPCQQEGRRDPLTRGEMAGKAPNLYYHYTILGGPDCTLFLKINLLAKIYCILEKKSLTETATGEEVEEETDTETDKDIDIDKEEE